MLATDCIACAIAAVTVGAKSAVGIYSSPAVAV